MQILLHKDRAKRQSCDSNILTLESTDMLSFMMGTITVTDVNMTVLATYTQVNCLTAFSRETSSRIFFTNSPMLFGPGKVNIALLPLCGCGLTWPLLPLCGCGLTWPLPLYVGVVHIAPPPLCGCGLTAG